MRITFITAGRAGKSGMREAAADYMKRIGRYCAVEEAAVSGRAASARMSVSEARKKDGALIAPRMKKGSFTVAMDQAGKTYTSEGLARLVEKVMAGAYGPGRDLCFIVGGPFGLHESIRERCDEVMSLSSLTLPHELARLVLFEQVYRAFTIIKGEPYSH